MELTLRLLYDELGSQEFETWLKLVVDYGRTHVASFHSIKGRSRSRGLGGIIRKKPGPPSLRSKSKYDLAQAFRFFLVLVHEPLLTVARRAANEEDEEEEEEEGEEVGAPCEREAASPEERANRARCAIAALEVAAKFSDTAKKPQLSEAATKDGLHAPAISLMALARTAFEGRKNFHLSPTSLPIGRSSVTRPSSTGISVHLWAAPTTSTPSTARNWYTSRTRTSRARTSSPSATLPTTSAAMRPWPMPSDGSRSATRT
jgi:hypothetical protein